MFYSVGNCFDQIEPSRSATERSGVRFHNYHCASHDPNCNGNSACVRGSPMVPVVGNICTIGTNLITYGTIGKEIGANGKNGNAIGTNGTNVTNQWYHWENSEHTQYSHRQEKQCCIFSSPEPKAHRWAYSIPMLHCPSVALSSLLLSTLFKGLLL